MHFGFVCNNYPPFAMDGHGSRTSVLAPGLVARGHQATVVGVAPPGRGLERDTVETRDGVRVVRLTPGGSVLRWKPRLLYDRIRLTARLHTEHRRSPFDLVDTMDSFGWMCFGAPADVPLTMRFAATEVLYNHLMGEPGFPFIHALEHRALRRATHFYAPSQWAALETLRLFGYRDHPVSVLYNAVDCDTFRPPETDRTEPGLIVFVNGIEPRKGCLELMQSVNIWARQFPGARLVMIGGDQTILDDGTDYKPVLINAIEPQFRDRVTFAGRLDRTTGVLDHLQRATLCVYPSYMETFGFAPVEAMAVGKPVIYTKYSAGPEVIEDGVSGLLCDPYSPESIADNICRLLGDTDLRERLGRGARARVLDRFNKDKWIDQYEAFFLRCIRSYGRCPAA